MKRLVIKIIGIIQLFIIANANLVAQKIILLNENTPKIALQKADFLIYEDSSNKLTINDIKQKSFYMHTSNMLNFSYSQSTYWIKLKVENNSRHQWILAVMATLIDNIEVYQFDGAHLVKQDLSGDSYPFSSRKYDVPVFLFDINGAKGTITEIYLSAKGIDTKQFELILEQYDYFIKNQHKVDSLWFYYFGLLSMMVVYNLMLYFSIVDRAYLFYVLYILNFIFAVLTMLGYGNQLFWGNYVWFNNRAPVFFSSSTGVFALLFAYNFLNVKHFLPKTRVVFVILIGLNIALTLATLIKPHWWLNYISPFLIISQVLLVVTIGIIIIRKNYPPAKYYLLSWAVLFVAIILFTLKMLGILPYSQINYTLLPIGAAIEVLLLSLGLGSRLNNAQKEKVLAQQQHLNQLQENEAVRSRIARDLHDDLGSTLSSIRILSEYAKQMIGSKPADSSKLLSKITQSSEKLQENLQDIVWTTQQKSNNISELLSKIRLFGGELLEAKNIKFSANISTSLNNIQLGSSKQYDLFMIYKEAINNIVKYSKATEVLLNFDNKNDFIVLEIRDNGQGFDTVKETDGNGLKNMKKRAESIAGTIQISSMVGQGTSIILQLPVTP